MRAKYTLKKASSIAGSVARLGRQLSTDSLPMTHQDTQQKNKVVRHGRFRVALTAAFLVLSLVILLPKSPITPGTDYRPHYPN